MIRVITYGTFDFLHYGHIRLLERAKALGDYLIVGVTSEDFDMARGKINVHQTLAERIRAVRETGLADEIIVEEYEGQKIDDIRRYDIDVFTVGSDWEGKFDYLQEYCRVVYLKRTENISSTSLRSSHNRVQLGLAGDTQFLKKVFHEADYVDGVKVCALCSARKNCQEIGIENIDFLTDKYVEMLSCSDAVYIRTDPARHYQDIKTALEYGRHVLCESPIALNRVQSEELFHLAEVKKLILMEAIKTAYATAFNRLLLLVKSGVIGQVYSVDATCTSLRKNDGVESAEWQGFFEWGPTALLPVFEILGTEYRNVRMISHFDDAEKIRDRFTKIEFIYNNAVASVKVADGVKSEGELIISGTEGYVYVPAPWWKTEYFEIRFENQNQNKRYFYQLDGEGIRFELLSFVRAVGSSYSEQRISEEVSNAISDIMDRFTGKKELIQI